MAELHGPEGRASRAPGRESPLTSRCAHRPGEERDLSLRQGAFTVRRRYEMRSATTGRVSMDRKVLRPSAVVTTPVSIS